MIKVTDTLRSTERMNKRKERAKTARRYLKIWFVVSQVLGFVGALTLGTFLDSGIEGYLWGYALGIVLSLGGTIGLS
jgi:ABC-type phosphate/phosphonate transport system permease subunit